MEKQFEHVYESRTEASDAASRLKNELLTLLKQERVEEFNRARPRVKCLDVIYRRNYTCVINLDFEGEDFSGLNLRGVDLRATNLRYVSFRNCDLRDAHFRASDITGAKFKGAWTRGAQFSRMIGYTLELQDRIAAIYVGAAERV